MKVYKFTASRAFAVLCITALTVGLIYAFVPQVSVSFSEPVTIAKADAAPPEKGSASDESVTLNEDKSLLVNKW